MCFHKPVLSLTRPNFLTDMIVETQFQALLQAPLVCPISLISKKANNGTDIKI